MDEVDFTILAATSVFTDLIEKCPPAEACRDAFDRTAKATIKMANSTGGFGQVLPRAQPQPQSHKQRNSRSSGAFDDRLNWSSPSSSNRSGGRHHRISADYNSRQAPSQYDVLSDTYSNSAASSAQLAAPNQNPSKRFRLSATNTATTATTDPSETNFSLMRRVPPQPRSTTSSAASALSPDTNSAAAGLIPSPSQQTSSPSLPTTADFYNNPLQPQNPLFTNSALQGMDFLQSLPGNNSNNGNLDPDFGGGQQDAAQMDFNLGLGWEGMHHDFSDGQQLDLFDGFFFGDQRGAGGGGAGGMGLGMVLDQATAQQQGMVEGEDDKGERG